MLQFFVQASDHGPEPASTNIVPVSIYLTQDPDSVPRFPSPSYSATVSENKAVGTKVEHLIFCFAVVFLEAKLKQFYKTF